MALATSQERAELTLSDRLLAEALIRTGIDARAVVWDEAAIDWGGFDLVVVRSTWDYHRRPEAFIEWAASVASRSRLLNPLGLVRWNVDKRYLRVLADAGVPIVDTVWLAPGDRVELQRIGEQLRASELVMKPVVGASAYGVEVLSALNPADERRLVMRLQQSVLLVQPLLRSIAVAGEFSVVCLDGHPTHVVKKRPRFGEIRVQPEFGGTAALTDGPPDVLEMAAHALEVLPELPVMARVDVARDEDDRPRLIELELIEPDLHFDLHPPAADRLAMSLASLSTTRFGERSARYGDPRA